MWGTNSSFVISILFFVFVFCFFNRRLRAQELCESRGGRPGLSVLTSLIVSVDVKNKKIKIEPCSRIGLSLSLMCQPTSEDIKQHKSINRRRSVVVTGLQF